VVLISAEDALGNLKRKGIPFPPQQLMFMPESHTQMLHHGFLMLAPIDRFGLYHDDSKILDIGCGYRRLAYALLAREWKGSYIGYDILKPHIEWLINQLLPHLLPGSGFTHIDIANSRYRPGQNATKAREAALPSPPFQPDLITLYSVFTHLYPDDITNYLQQIYKIMGLDTRIACTWFFRTTDMIQLELDGKSQYPMKYQHSENCWYYDENDPLWAISYNLDWIERQVKAAGLTIEQTLLGSWCGRRETVTYQDMLILKKQT
jgi:SAM-dependent methyltransferase